MCNEHLELLATILDRACGCKIECQHDQQARLHPSRNWIKLGSDIRLVIFRKTNLGQNGL